MTMQTVPVPNPKNDESTGAEEIHPLLAALANAPLEPISDEEMALLLELSRSRHEGTVYTHEDIMALIQHEP